MKKFISFMFMVVLFSLSAFAGDYKNPYVNKNIDTHTKEFLAYEIISDFHKGVEKYNNERKDLPEAKLVDNHYEILDGKNKVAFNIQIALKGDFYYNGELTNLKVLKDQKNKIVPKTSFFNYIISDVEAGVITATTTDLSTVLLAALIKLDSRIVIKNEKDWNRYYLQLKIGEVYTQCRKLEVAPDDKEAGGKIDQFFKQIDSNISANSRLNPMKTFEESEDQVVKNHLLHFEQPNCSLNQGMADKIGDYRNDRSNQNNNNTKSAGSVITMKGADGYDVAVPQTEDEQDNQGGKYRLADIQVCAQLAQLKSCLVTNTNQSGNSARTYMNKIQNNDLEQYVPAASYVKEK